MKGRIARQAILLVLGAVLALAGHFIAMPLGGAIELVGLVVFYLTFCWTDDEDVPRVLTALFGLAVVLALASLALYWLSKGSE